MARHGPARNIRQAHPGSRHRDARPHRAQRGIGVGDLPTEPQLFSDPAVRLDFEAFAACVAGIQEAVEPVAAVDVELDILPVDQKGRSRQRSEEHTSELQSLMRTSYAVFCLKKKKKYN